MIALITAISSIINGRKLTTMHQQINSQQDKLIEATKAQSHLEGAAQERTENRERTLVGEDTLSANKHL